MKHFLLIAVFIPSLCLGERLYYNNKMEPCRARKATFFCDKEKLDNGKWSVKTYRISDTLMHSSGTYFSIDPEKIDTLTKYDMLGGIKERQIFANDSANTLKTQIYYDSSGVIQSISKYEKQRVFTESWYPNGKLRHKYMRTNNELHGNVVSYYPDGSIKRNESYDKGKQLAGGECYDKKGNLQTCSPFFQSPCFSDNQTTVMDCTNDFRRWVAENIQYPHNVKPVESIVRALISFTIDKEGAVGIIKLQKSTGYSELDDEIIRVFNSSPIWAPGLVDGEPVNVRFVLPIAFQPRTVSENPAKSIGPSSWGAR